MADSTVFEGIAPGAHEGMVELKDGRWMMVWPGLNVSYSNGRGRTWSASESLQTRGESIIGTGAPTCLSTLAVGQARPSSTVALAVQPAEHWLAMHSAFALPTTKVSHGRKKHSSTYPVRLRATITTYSFNSGRVA